MAKGVMIILDGYGEGKAGEYNAVINAKTPTLDMLKTKSYSLLKTHGESVGLFENEMGGSEVGHMTIGAGRVVPSTAKLIKDEIENGMFEKNKTLTSSLNNLKKNKGNLHLIGLMSDKNIHSNINHCLKIIEMAKSKVNHIFIHFIADGRDCGVFDSLKYLNKLQKFIKNIKNCSILSVSGRFYAMDRENYQERTNEAFNAMFYAKNTIVDVEDYIISQHNAENNDQYIVPMGVKNKNYNGVNKNDLLLFFNFREDRLRQIVKKCESLDCDMLTMSDVANTDSKAIYPATIVKNTMSEHLSKNNLSQIKISETTKYAHVTYFLNGGKETPFDKEDRLHIQTKETVDYAKTPKMRAAEIAKQTINSMKNNYDAIIVNFSNADMIGHTGNYNAVVKSLEFLDKCVAKIIKYANKMGYFVMVTADHGNSEQMMTSCGQPDTSHTINKVLCSIANRDLKMKKYGELKDVAPTFVELLGLPQNKHFDGKSLII